MTSSDSWFESWFDSPLYEQLYAGRDDAEAAQLVGWIAGLLPPEQFPDVLDMGCGRGRHSLLLAEKGYSVTGVDLSPRAIHKARKRAAEEKAMHARFEIGDMRTWKGDPCDLVCNLFTSFGYFENDDDNLSVIANMCRNAKEEGYLVMDYLNPGYVRRNLVPVEKIAIGDMTCLIHRNIEKDMVIKSISFVPSDGRHSMYFQERVKLYDIDWFIRAFAGRGMILTDVRGNYQGSNYDPMVSSRMLMVISKEK
ncbi:MAG: class I SAM-dependent methyltransferase [Cyclonatronaceae bacterium]